MPLTLGDVTTSPTAVDREAADAALSAIAMSLLVVRHEGEPVNEDELHRLTDVMAQSKAGATFGLVAVIAELGIALDQYELGAAERVVRQLATDWVAEDV